MSASASGDRMRGKMGLAGPETRAGPRRSSGLPAELGWKGKREGREKEKRVFNFSKSTQANEFKPRFEFKHSKQCTSMYATLNSYIFFN
jgi:hypothetical protein